MRQLPVAIAVTALSAACLSAPPEAIEGEPTDAGDADVTDGSPGLTTDAAACDAVGLLPGFADVFDDDELAWAVTGRNGVGAMAIGVVDGGLELSPTLSGSDWGYVQTIDRFDATGMRFVARIDSVTEPIDEVRNYFGLLDPDAGEEAADMVFVEEGGVLSSPVGSIEYEAESARWWQVRSDGDVLYFEISSDGIQFEPLGALVVPADFNLSDSFFEVGIEMETSPSSAPGTFRIDLLNVPPCE